MTETKYVFVKSKEKKHLSLGLLYDKVMWQLFHNPFQFVWNMVIYHALILFIYFAFGINIPAKVFVQIGFGDPVGGIAQETQSLITILSWHSAIFLAVILILDFALLVIIRDEIKPKPYEVDANGNPKQEWLTYPKIFMIEFVVFIIGVFSPYMRLGLLFFSGNTVQVAIVKKWVITRWRPERLQFGTPAKYFFIFGSYLLIIDMVRRIIIYYFTKT